VAVHHPSFYIAFVGTDIPVMHSVVMRYSLYVNVNLFSCVAVWGMFRLLPAASMTRVLVSVSQAIIRVNGDQGP
jgi:hypothetical protein